MKPVKPILFAIFFLFVLRGYSVQTLPFGIRAEKYAIMQSIVKLMDNNAYDSAEAQITRELLNQNNKLNEREEYFLYCYEAEIMYYNALFDIGMASAKKALNLAEKLENDTLIGSAQNLLGLQYMHLETYTEAKVSFKKAIKLLPPKTLKELYSQRYHALANLAEVYLYQNLPDSAAFYSQLAIVDALEQGAIRGASFSYWSLAESELLQNAPLNARESVKKGLALLQNEEVEDAHLFLCMTMMKVFDALEKPDSANIYKTEGEKFAESPNASDYAKLSFLEFLAKHSLAQRNVDEAYNMLNRLEVFRNGILKRQEKQRLRLLTGFFKGKEELLKTQILNESQQKEIRLTNIITYILAVLMVFLALFAYITYRNIKQKQRIARLNYKSQLQKKQVEMEIIAIENRLAAISTERNRIASDLHDDIGAALSSIHIYSTVAVKKFKSGNDIENLLLRIKETSAGLLERMSDIIWSINPEHEKLRDLKLRIKTFAADLLFPLGISINYELQETDDELHVAVLERKNIYLTCKEIINNIAKHSAATHVKLCLKQKDNRLHCTFTDNGRGFDTLKPTTGNGIRNMKRRIKDVGGDFYYSSQLGAGTEIEFSVPLTNISD